MSDTPIAGGSQSPGPDLQRDRLRSAEPGRIDNPPDRGGQPAFSRGRGPRASFRPSGPASDPACTDPASEHLSGYAPDRSRPPAEDQS